MAHKDAYGALGKSDIFKFDPEDLTIEDDPGSAIYDETSPVRPPEFMVQSMIDKGNITPIKFRRDGKDAAGKPIIKVVAGRTRVLAARVANKILRDKGDAPIVILGTVHTGDDDAAFDTMVVENVYRRDSSVMTKARYAAKAIARGRTKKQAAAFLLVTTTTLDTYLKLLECDKSVQDAVDAEELSAANAKILADLPRAEQAAALEQMRTDSTLKGKSGEAAAKQLAQRRGPATNGSRNGAAALQPVPRKSLLRKFYDVALAEVEDQSVREVLALVLEGKPPTGKLGLIWAQVVKSGPKKRSGATEAT